jgi:hypothetical protein
MAQIMKAKVFYPQKLAGPRECGADGVVDSDLLGRLRSN